jgi:mannonate dehydratase
VALSFLTSSHIDREKRGAIMLGQSPERDRDIEDIQKMIAACAQAGIPCIKYNMSLLGVLRVERTPGRGGSSYSTWRLADAKADPPLTRAERVTEEMAWERITYFLERVIPVCEEYKVRFACHPHDPGVPPAGFQGIYRVLGTVEGMKKFVSIKESPYHGLNLCLGSTSENLNEPNREIHDVIRYFGTRKKIFNIHFRNIRGQRDDFQEVYPDEGDMDMLQVMRTLYEVDYEYMVMPDHTPRHPDEPRRSSGFRFCLRIHQGPAAGCGNLRLRAWGTGFEAASDCDNRTVIERQSDRTTDGASTSLPVEAVLCARLTARRERFVCGGAVSTVAWAVQALHRRNQDREASSGAAGAIRWTALSVVCASVLQA